MDGKASASVVVVDPQEAARRRSEAARKELSDAVEPPLLLHVIQGLEYTVPFTLKVVGPADDIGLKDKAETVLRRCLDECNEFLNHYNPNSEVSQLNRLASGVPHSMSPHLSAVLQASLRVNQSSGGLFDPAAPAVGALLRRELAEHARSPSELFVKELFDALNTYATVRSLHIDFVKGTVTKSDARTQLDLGGVNKGYAIDRVIHELKQSGMPDAMFEWGGDVKAAGLNHKREPWRLGVVRPPPLAELKDIRKPPQDNQNCSYVSVIRLEDGEAVATSGDYENLWRTAQGSLRTTHFHPRIMHFLHPTDRAIAQISVKSTSCMYADALATAALLKSDFATIRGFLENWRFAKFAVRDWSAYIRQDELLAKMHQVSAESAEMRQIRISGCLPARVVVVGGGLAGLCAAIEAARCGASVVLIEKTVKLGGNSAKATSGINGWGTNPQCERDIADGGKFFERDTFVSGRGGLCDTGLVQTLSEHSRGAIHWLMKEFRLPLTVISQLGGHSRPRTHRAPDKADGTPVPVGYTIMQHLIQHVQTELAGRVAVLLETAVVGLLHNPAPHLDERARVIGLVYRGKDGVDIQLLADSVVLTTGGFSNDHTSDSLLKEYAPKIAHMPTTNGPFATGDGVKVARQIGAMLIDMDKVQLHPTGLLDPNDPANPTKYLGPEALRGSGGVLLNQHGKRFVNELDLRSVVSAAIMKQNLEYPKSNGCRVAYCVLNPAAVKLFGPNSLGFYRDRLKLFKEVPDVAALASLIGVPAEVVGETLDAYGNLSRHQTRCPDTGKSVFPCVVDAQGPFTVALVTPSIHYCMGGVGITPSAEVLDTVEAHGIGTKHRRTILGLFAAGEVTGGLHGANRLGGNSLLECVVFGRIAGDRAATILQRSPTALSQGQWSAVVLREFREGQEYGQGSRVLRFNLPGAAQRSGLELGQFVAIKGEWDGKQLLGYYSPITLPHDPGVIGILARVDKGNLTAWISSLKPGDAVYMKACGGLTIKRDMPSKSFYLNGVRIERIGLVAGGTGIAPMLQLIRAALKHPYRETIREIGLIYAAEELSELTYKDVLLKFQQTSPELFKCHFVLNKPPPGWTDGVGFIDHDVLSGNLPAAGCNTLVVICGPPVMQRVVMRLLHAKGYEKHMVRTVDEDSAQAPMQSRL